MLIRSVAGAPNSARPGNRSSMLNAPRSRDFATAPAGGAFRHRIPRHHRVRRHVDADKASPIDVCDPAAGPRNVQPAGDVGAVRDGLLGTSSARM
jgi:hypothetical protein